MIDTDRLILRPFRDGDRDAFAALNGDSRVSAWLGGPIDRAVSDARTTVCMGYRHKAGNDGVACEGVWPSQD